MSRIALAAAASFVLTVAVTSAISKSIGNPAHATASIVFSDAGSAPYVSVGWLIRTVVVR